MVLMRGLEIEGSDFLRAILDEKRETLGSIDGETIDRGFSKLSSWRIVSFNREL